MRTILIALLMMLATQVGADVILCTTISVSASVVEQGAYALENKLQLWTLSDVFENISKME